MQPPIIAVTNQKGGVGKTTTCVNMAAALSHLGYRILMIDIDPQGNATTACGIKQHQMNHSVLDWFNQADTNAGQAIEKKGSCGFDVVGANYKLSSVLQTDSSSMNHQILSEKIGQISHHYDCILIDCPPAFGYLTWNALAVASGLLVPMQCEYYPLEGLSTIVATVKKLKQSINSQLKIVGIVRTMFDRRNRLSNEVSEQLITHFGTLVYQSVIPRNVRLAEAPSYGKSAIVYDPNCSGSMAYMALALEFIRKMRLTRTTPLISSAPS